MVKQAYLLYPHQLFEEVLLQHNVNVVFLVEEPLFFTQFSFHKQKLVLHRASMKSYAFALKEKGFTVFYVETKDIKQTAEIVNTLLKHEISRVHLFDLADNWLEKRVIQACSQSNICIEFHESPSFFLSKEEAIEEFSHKTKFNMAPFYVAQRKRLDIMIDNGKPTGGKWSFDTENRKKIPKGIKLPSPPSECTNDFVTEAKTYVEKHFRNHYGLIESFIYPIDHKEARKWLQHFLEHHLPLFGDYQDAIVTNDSFVFHSLLSPLLNTGLLTPNEVINRALTVAKNGSIPLNCLEGFIRQIIGWREFVRGVYSTVGSKQRTTNFWNHQRRLPKSFWDGSTGILPVDVIIQKVNKTGYAHHIERLMVMANFMLLCEIHPDDIYRWFMELFIDAYDWVMVPNVYGMGGYADGGMITTKPYISSANYILKMSDFPKGEWADIWTSLYWNFIHKNFKVFQKNPRCAPMILLLEKMDEKVLSVHLNRAKNFLNQL